MEYRSRHATEPEWALPSYLDEAQRIIAATRRRVPHARASRIRRARDDFEELRWFPLPSEVLAELRGASQTNPAISLRP